MAAAASLRHASASAEYWPCFQLAFRLRSALQACVGPCLRHRAYDSGRFSWQTLTRIYCGRLKMRLDSVAPVHDLAHPQRDLASGVTEGDRARLYIRNILRAGRC